MSHTESTQRHVGYFWVPDLSDPSLHDIVLDVLDQETPAVEEAGPGAAYVDLSGLERLHPRLSTLLAQLAMSVDRALPDPLTVKAGSAPNKFAAEAAVRYSRGHRYPVLSTPEEAKQFLAPLPIDILPVDDSTKEHWSFLGLQHLGQLAQQHPEAIATRFGRIGRRGWELAQGIDNRPVHPSRRFRPIEETLVFPAPVSEWSMFWVGVRHGLARVWQRRERKDKTIRQLRLMAPVGETFWDRVLTFHENIGDLRSLENRLRRRLQGMQFPGAAASLTLQITALGPTHAGQGSLFPGSDRRLKRIGESLAGIKARDGQSGLYTIAEVDVCSRIPERRYALVSFDP